MPYLIAVVGVKGIYAIVFGDRKHHIVRALARKRNFRKEQGLCVDNSLHRRGEQLSKSIGVHVLSGQNSFLEIMTGACDVIVISNNIGRETHQRRKQTEDHAEQCWSSQSQCTRFKG